MRVIFLVVILFCASLSHAQKGRKVALEKTNKEDYKSKIESLKKDPNQALSQSDEVDTKVDTSKKVSAFEKTSRRERKKMDGNRGIHLVISPEQDPLIQEGVNL